MRSGLSPTPATVRVEPGTISAATSGNAAEDGSPGTVRADATSSGWPATVMRRPSFPSDTATWAPKWRSMFSVWSRVGSGSITLVSPGALRPASSTADFTCADGTGKRYSIGSGSLVPMTASGRRPPSRPTKRAPIARSGVVTRAIGRRHSDSSPVKKLVKGWVATSPIKRRAPVPELPRSSTASGSASPPSPTPCMVHAPSALRSIGTPRRRSARAVLSTSSPSSKPAMRVVPTATAPKISARCDTDLSPGIAMRPDNARAFVERSGNAAVAFIENNVHIAGVGSER